VEFAEAVARVRAAVDAAREAAEQSDDATLVVARTDARATHGMDEAIRRCQAFAEVGADITFLEAPESRDEMRRYCAEVGGYRMANMLEGGKTPVLPPAELEEMGFALAAYPLTLLNASIVGMRGALDELHASGGGGGVPAAAHSLPFAELQRVVGFPDYYEEEERYRT